MWHHRIDLLICLAIHAICQSAFAQTPAQLLSAEEIQRFSALEATQAVAVDEQHFYAIANDRIGKYSRSSGKLVQRWKASAEIPLTHLNSGIIRDGQLWCAHSNYPAVPEASSVEVWDARSLQHVATHSFGIYEGSLTWVDWHDGAWWAVFAHYSIQNTGNSVRDSPPAAESVPKNRWTSLVKFDAQWRRMAAWTFPEALLKKFHPYSCSGGSWGDDGMLYCTGHDLGELYRLRLPRAGSVLDHVDTISLPITGQGFAWDRQSPGTLFGIHRPKREVVVAVIPKRQ